MEPADKDSDEIQKDQHDGENDRFLQVSAADQSHNMSTLDKRHQLVERRQTALREARQSMIQRNASKVAQAKKRTMPPISEKIQTNEQEVQNNDINQEIQEDPSLEKAHEPSQLETQDDTREENEDDTREESEADIMMVENEETIVTGNNSEHHIDTEPEIFEEWRPSSFRECCLTFFSCCAPKLEMPKLEMPKLEMPKLEIPKLTQDLCDDVPPPIQAAVLTPHEDINTVSEETEKPRYSVAYKAQPKLDVPPAARRGKSEIHELQRQRSKELRSITNDLYTIPPNPKFDENIDFVKSAPEGGYLVYEELNNGTLNLRWSREFVENAICFARSNSKIIPRYKFTTNKGREELIRNCHDSKQYCSGWINYVSNVGRFCETFIMLPSYETRIELKKMIVCIQEDEKQPVVLLHESSGPAQLSAAATSICVIPQSKAAQFWASAGVTLDELGDESNEEKHLNLEASLIISKGRLNQIALSHGSLKSMMN